VEQAGSQIVGTTSLNALKNGLDKLRNRLRWASSWIDLLSPRPLWLKLTSSEATQGELQGELFHVICYALID